MYYSVRTIATNTGLTREAIYKHLNNIKGFKNKYTIKKNNKLMINDAGYKLLAGSRQNLSTNSSTNRLLKVYKNQIKHKNKQIDKLDKLLDQQQQLQLKTQDQYNNLLIKHDNLLKLTSKHNDNHSKQVDTNHGFWWHLFH